MTRISVCLLALLIATNLGGALYYVATVARWRRYVAILKDKIWRRDTAMFRSKPIIDITSDWVLIDQYRHAEIQRCQPLQVWLLQSRKMSLDTADGSIWVTVERVGDKFKLAGDIAGVRLSCYGSNFDRACANFKDQIIVRRAHRNRKV